ncbi:(4Fe-4S)-binding protein [bacterium]|nr:(4Fe-4S)-binding protein [bacterium]
MKKIVITGGKGGCGKTTVAASLAYLSKNWVIADCDVDSPNLGILAQPTIEGKHSFKGTSFKIDLNSCKQCGLCRDKCAYGAIDEHYIIDPILCESCGYCKVLCNFGAIDETEVEIGYWRDGSSRFGPFFDAYLYPGAENSGKLVTLLREKAEKRAEQSDAHGVIIDGPPGIGCPVIASITGTDLAIAVAEPTISGLHDVSRIVELSSTLKSPVGLLINKADISSVKEAELRTFAKDNNIEILGALPYEPMANKAQSAMKTMVEYAPEGDYAIEMGIIWNKILALLGE